MNPSVEEFLKNLCNKPHTTSTRYPATFGELTPASMEEAHRYLSNDSRVKIVKLYHNGSGLLVGLRIELAGLSVCRHSLDTGLPVEVLPDQSHTCREIAHCPGSQCRCDPVQITDAEFERMKGGFLNC